MRRDGTEQGSPRWVSTWWDKLATLHQWASVSEVLTWVGLQRLAVPLSDATAVAVALVPDTMHKFLPGVTNLVKCPGL